MTDKAVELLDKVIADQDTDAFVKDTFATQRTNPATLSKVKTGIAFRIQSSKVPDADKAVLQTARNALYDYIARLANGDLVTDVLKQNQEYENNFEKYGTSATPPE